jgi:hypothetical protein
MTPEMPGRARAWEIPRRKDPLGARSDQIPDRRQDGPALPEHLEPDRRQFRRLEMPVE